MADPTAVVKIVHPDGTEEAYGPMPVPPGVATKLIDLMKAPGEAFAAAELERKKTEVAEETERRTAEAIATNQARIDAALAGQEVL